MDMQAVSQQFGVQEEVIELQTETFETLALGVDRRGPTIEGIAVQREFTAPLTGVQVNEVRD